MAVHVQPTGGRLPLLHIAVGVLIDVAGRVLIAQRQPGTPGAGKWEFPGGKREQGESIEQALARELREELGITVRMARPLIRLAHAYSDRSVLLDVWRVTQWDGYPRGVEGQPVLWSEINHLSGYDLLAANKPIVDAIRLPEQYLLTPVPGDDLQAFVHAVDSALAAGLRLLRLRAWSLDDVAYQALAVALQTVADNHGAQLLLDRDAAMLERVGAAGLHWPAAALKRCQQRPVAADQWFALSCHNRQELQQALALGADFATLSPVAATPSHPDVAPLGWDGFGKACDGLPLPVYALGGVGPKLLPTAHQRGAQGIAAIRALWPQQACAQVR